MDELARIFEALVDAAKRDTFEAAVMGTPLATATLRSHPLGFKVARIVEEGTSLRLHLWRGGKIEQPGFEVHDHGFDLMSHVVEGTLRQRTYRARETPYGDRRIYRVAYQNGQSVLRKTETIVELAQKTDELIFGGTTYSLEAGELHEAELENCPHAISLVLTRETGRVPITVGPVAGPAELVSTRPQIENGTLAQLGLRGALAA